jgi:acid stress chaperone HdeB
MKKYWQVALLAGFLPFSTLQASDVINIEEITCEDLFAEDEETIGLMLFWLDGYLAGVTGDTRLSLSGIEHFAENVGSACAKSPEAKLLAVAKIVGIE